MPVLHGEGRLRLLNLQCNMIEKIEGERLVGLDCLIYLDLYNNKISQISGLEAVPCLRILMLGSNR